MRRDRPSRHGSRARPPGWRGSARRAGSSTIAAGHVELRAPRLDGPVAHRDLGRGLRVASCGRVPAGGHQFFDPSTAAALAGTPRRGGAGGRRSSTRRPRDWRPRGARSATSARNSPIARCFSASISEAARTRMRSGSSRVAAMSASRVSWATFWARVMISLASRRASVSAADALRAPRSRGHGAPVRRP